MNRRFSRFAGALALLLAALVTVPAMAQNVDIGRAGLFRIFATNEDGVRARCSAIHSAGPRRYIITFDGRNWYAGVEIARDVTGMGTYTIDGQTMRNANYQSDGMFGYVRMENVWVNRMAAGNWMTFNMPGTPPIRMTLEDTRAAITRLRQCANGIPAGSRGSGFSSRDEARAGAGPVQPAQPATPPPAVTMPPPVIAQPPAIQPSTPTMPALVQPSAPSAPFTLGAGCPTPGTIGSQATGLAIPVTFDVRNADDTLTLYWLDGTGNELQLGPLTTGMQSVQGHVGDVFIVKDTQGDCLGGVMRASDQINTFVVR